MTGPNYVEFLKLLSQELVDKIGLHTGLITLELHEGAVCKMQVHVDCLVLVKGEFVVRKIELERNVQKFIRSEIQTLMLNYIGRFGTLTVDAIDGHVIRAGIHVKWKQPHNSNR